MDMTIKSRRALLATALTAVVGSALAAQPPKPEPPRNLNVGPGNRAYRIFNSMIYAAMPNLQSLGMPRLLSTGSLWRPKVPHSQVDPEGIADAVHALEGHTNDYYFDLEEWPLSNVAPEVVSANIDKLAQVAVIARRVQPRLKFGFYDMAPRGTYWPLVLNKTGDLQQWHELNQRSSVIAAQVDYAFPSLYTFYDNLPEWEAAARGVLQNARQYGKPVYPFLWPQYHDSNAALKGTYVPPEFWRRQLETCRDHADGFVLWGGYKQRWDENAVWWQEVRQMATEMRIQDASL